MVKLAAWPYGKLNFIQYRRLHSDAEYSLNIDLEDRRGLHSDGEYRAESRPGGPNIEL